MTAPGDPAVPQVPTVGSLGYSLALLVGKGAAVLVVAAPGRIPIMGVNDGRILEPIWQEQSPENRAPRANGAAPENL